MKYVMNHAGKKFCLFLLVVMSCSSVLAGELMMVRSKQAFPEAMTELQNTIIAHGYKISRVQRVDIGLTKNNYKTDKYRVVFFGKKKEMADLVKNHPDFAPYLPLKISIFAEGEQTILVSMNPEQMAQLYNNAKLRVYFTRWKQDLRSILNKVATSK